MSTGNPGYVIVPQYGPSKITVFVWGKNTLYDPKICRNRKHKIKVCLNPGLNPGQGKKPKNSNFLLKNPKKIIIIWYCAKVIPKRFHLNGNTKESHPQFKKLVRQKTL